MIFHAPGMILSEITRNESPRVEQIINIFETRIFLMKIFNTSAFHRLVLYIRLRNNSSFDSRFHEWIFSQVRG